MDSPVLAYAFESEAPRALPDLALVRLLQAVTTDEGERVPAGTIGTVVAAYAGGAAYEVEFEAGLATVAAAALESV